MLDLGPFVLFLMVLWFNIIRTGSELFKSVKFKYDTANYDKNSSLNSDVNIQFRSAVLMKETMNLI